MMTCSLINSEVDQYIALIARICTLCMSLFFESDINRKSQSVTSTSNRNGMNKRNVTSSNYDFAMHQHRFCSFLLKPNALYSHEEVSILLKLFTDST